MSSFQIQNAVRSQKYPKLAISGPSGAGKTATSLLICRGMGAEWGQIAVIDTEHSSSSLYSNSKPYGISEQIGEFKIIQFNPPHTLERYLEVLDFARASKVKYLIIDSFSHSWNGEGGTLDKVAEIQKRVRDQQAAWKDINPILTRLINKVLDYPGAVICTMRSKQEYSRDIDPTTGKIKITKLGLGPVVREGIEYEFDTVFDMDVDHFGSTSKDRTGLFSNQKLIMDIGIGKRFEEWRQSGSPTAPIDYGVSTDQSIAPPLVAVTTYQSPNLLQPLSGNLSGDLGGSLNTTQSAPAQTTTVADPFSQPQITNQPVVPQSNVISDIKSLAEECERFIALTKQYDVSGDVSKAMCRKALAVDDNYELKFANLTAEQVNKCYYYCKAQLEKPEPTAATVQTQVLSGVLF